MKIGVIGCGVVGGTILTGYKALGYDVLGYDPYKDEYITTSFDDITKCDVLFLCLPTVPDSSDKMIMKPLDETFEKLNEREYKGLIILKSTVIPGTTRKYALKYQKLDILHSPEFLTEARATFDFFCPDRIVVGSTDKYINEQFFEIHKIFNCPIMEVDAETSELAKFMSNAFFATKVSFANEWNEIALHYRADYDAAKRVLYTDKRVGADHLSINEDRAYGGMCLPKDVTQITKDLNDQGITPLQLEATDDVNGRTQKLIKRDKQ